MPQQKVKLRTAAWSSGSCRTKLSLGISPRRRCLPLSFVRRGVEGEYVAELAEDPGEFRSNHKNIKKMLTVLLAPDV
jgi:hypothetical protein